MESRRAFLRATLFGVAAAAVGVPIRASAATPGLPPLWLVAPFKPGDSLGLGWSLARVFPAIEGAVTLNLLHGDGRKARVDLSLREGAPKGPASTAFLDFIVMDGGDGSAPMDESLGRVVRRLAAAVAENEAQIPEQLPSLQAHADRVWRHAASLAVASRQLNPGPPVESGA